MMIMIMQQIAKTLEVVQDVLVTVCTVKNENEKEAKMKQYVEKIELNKNEVAEVCKNQISQCRNETDYPLLPQKQNNQIENQIIFHSLKLMS